MIVYSKRQIKRNDGSVQANCATKEFFIPKWVISIPILIMFINFTMLIFYNSENPPKLRILANSLSEWQTKFWSPSSFINLIKLLGLIK